MAQRSARSRFGKTVRDVHSHQQPPLISDFVVCQYTLDTRHGGQPNSLFPNLGHYSQIRSSRVVYYMDVSDVGYVASTPSSMREANI
jgi:hypothetical protein